MVDKRKHHIKRDYPVWNILHSLDFWLISAQVWGALKQVQLYPMNFLFCMDRDLEISPFHNSTSKQQKQWAGLPIQIFSYFTVWKLCIKLNTSLQCCVVIVCCVKNIKVLLQPIAYLLAKHSLVSSNPFELEKNSIEMKGWHQAQCSEHALRRDSTLAHRVAGGSCGFPLSQRRLPSLSWAMGYVQQQGVVECRLWMGGKVMENEQEMNNDLCFLCSLWQLIYVLIYLLSDC